MTKTPAATELAAHDHRERISRTPVPTIAHTLLRGICEGNPQPQVRQRPLMRWLEAQLRDRDPGHAQLRMAPARPEPTNETPRSG